MNDLDKFDDLYDKFKKNQKSKLKANLNKKSLKEVGVVDVKKLPLWKEVNTFNLNNNIKRLKDKQILVPVAKRVLAINDNILLMVSEPRLTINFVKANDTRGSNTAAYEQVSPQEATSGGHTGVTE